MKRLAFPLIFSLIASVACVTVNVNFPEATVQKATDDYVRELYRSKEKGRAPTAPAAPAKTGDAPKSSRLDFSLVSEALAADAELSFKVDTDKALAIRDRLAGRLDDVLEQKRAGVLGESNDGKLTLKNPDKLKKLFQKKIEKLVADEDTDRTELYGEILRANNLPKARLKDIEKSFSRSFQAESPSGTWVQDTDGKWTQKQ